MNSHELGDEYEKICKAYLKELYSKTDPNPQFIDTKSNKIHGIDFAISLNDDEIIFIVESKGKYGKISKEQMTKPWIQKRITPELAEKIKNNIEKNGIIKYLSFRVNADDKNNIKVSRIKPSGELNATEFLQNQTTKKTTTMAKENSFKYQIELLEALEKRLEGFAENMLRVATQYEKQVENLHQNGGMIDEIYEHYVTNCLEQTKQRINGLVTHLKDNDLAEVKRLIDRLNNF